LLFSFALEYTIRKVQENNVELKLNWTHHLLVSANDVDLLRNNIGSIKKTPETLSDASKKIGLEVNAEKTSICCCLVTRRQDKIMT
jgi:hypothetical protein